MNALSALKPQSGGHPIVPRSPKGHPFSSPFADSGQTFGLPSPHCRATSLTLRRLRANLGFTISALSCSVPHQLRWSSTMKDIICPHCNKAFKVDETGYADILKQVHDSEFEQQLHERLELAEKDKLYAVELAKEQAANESQKTT
jgi:hypothetical protein